MSPYLRNTGWVDGMDDRLTLLYCWNPRTMGWSYAQPLMKPGIKISLVLRSDLTFVYHLPEIPFSVSPLYHEVFGGTAIRPVPDRIVGMGDRGSGGNWMMGIGNRFMRSYKPQVYGMEGFTYPPILYIRKICREQYQNHFPCSDKTPARKIFLSALEHEVF